MPEPDGPTRATNDPGREDREARRHVRSRPKNRSVSSTSYDLSPCHGHWAAARPLLRDEEAGVLLEDRLLEGQHLRRRVDPELAGEDGAQLAERAQRLALGAGLVLREDEELPATFAQGRGTHQGVRQASDLPRPPAAQHRVHVHLLRLEAQLVEPPASRRAGGQSGRSAKAGPRHWARACSSRKATRSLSPTVRSARARVTRASKSWASTSSGGTART